MRNDRGQRNESDKNNCANTKDISNISKKMNDAKNEQLNKTTSFWMIF